MENLKLRTKSKAEVKKTPESPGVYLFFGRDKEVLYIGKANNLKARLSSYFGQDLAPKTEKMISESTHFAIIEVVSELESLLLEAKLIREKMPRYNVELKDDKHPLYIQITKEEFPRVLAVRKDKTKDKSQAVFGPFPSSTNVKLTLKMLRKIFPYAEHKPGKRACLYSQMGLCNPCPSVIENSDDLALRSELKKEYRKNLSRLSLVLSGGLGKVKKSLEKEMRELSKNKKFEKAATIRDKVQRLDYITQPVTPVEKFIENPSHIEDIRSKELKELQSILGDHLALPKNLERIECYDVAHLGGTKPAASMVVFINAEQDKSLYRHFRIRQTKKGSDTDSLAEVAKRRARRLRDWGKPELIIVDGGKGQVGVFDETFRKHNITVVGIAKREETLIIPTKEGYTSVRPKGEALHLIQRMRDEAHRFARRYHHKLLQKSLLES